MLLLRFFGQVPARFSPYGPKFRTAFCVSNQVLSSCNCPRLVLQEMNWWDSNCSLISKTYQIHHSPARTILPNSEIVSCILGNSLVVGKEDAFLLSFLAHALLFGVRPCWKQYPMVKEQTCPQWETQGSVSGQNCTKQPAYYAGSR